MGHLKSLKCKLLIPTWLALRRSTIYLNFEEEWIAIQKYCGLLINTIGLYKYSMKTKMNGLLLQQHFYSNEQIFFFHLWYIVSDFFNKFYLDIQSCIKDLKLHIKNETLLFIHAYTYLDNIM